MRRVNTQGIQLANKYLLMAAVCYNLKRLLKWISEAELKEGKMLLQYFFTLWCLLLPEDRKMHLAVCASIQRDRYQ